MSWESTRNPSAISHTIVEVESMASETPNAEATATESHESPPPKLIPSGENNCQGLIRALKKEGRLGLFWDRSQRNVGPTYFDINIANFRSASRATLHTALTRLATYNAETNPNYALDQNVLQVTADYLADGVMIAAYSKLRIVCGLDINRMSRFARKPKSIPVPFELPRPFAFAVSELGIVDVSSLTKRMICVPSAKAEDTANFFLPATCSWNLPAYTSAVEYAKSLGMEFLATDLHVKKGSSWWLHTHTASDEFQSVDCPLPEDNFTETTAIFYTFFCPGVGAQFGTDLFDLSSISDTVYAHLIVNPHHGINVNSFFACTSDRTPHGYRRLLDSKLIRF